MSIVAKRSGASPGVIYHYFESKDDLLRAAYVDVKTASIAAIDAAGLEDLPPRDAFMRMWINAYRYFVANRIEAQFIEQYEGMPGYKTPEVSAALAESEHYAALRRRFYSDEIGFPLKPLPIGVVNELTFTAALRLAVRLEPLDAEAQMAVAEACWAAISR